MENYVYKDLIYANALSASSDVADWRMEGEGTASFPMNRMRLEGYRDPSDGQAANIVFWCPEDFPDHISISWDFYAIRDPGLCILFFAAKGCNGEDLFDPSLAKREGPYKQYHHGDINALHVSYFRRKHPKERAFTTCNLRKSYGAHFVAQGADPLPPIGDFGPPYKIELIKDGPTVVFGIGGGPKEVPIMHLFSWEDDGESFGPILEDGKIGFRQMTPLIAEYGNLQVCKIEKGE